MKRKELARLVAECRPLLKTATPEQRLRMLRLIREGYRRVKQDELPYLLVEREADMDAVLAENQRLDSDYLEEK